MNTKLTINTNLSSLIVQRNLKTSSNKLNLAIERMTTGAKINRAKDNAANFSINTNLSSKLNSYQVAQENTSMGLDMLATAMDSLDLLNDHLTRLRDLAEQAANGTYGQDSLNAIQAEADARTDECTRVIENTEYNGIDLLKAKENGFIQDVEKRAITEEMIKMSEVEDTDTLHSGETYVISSVSDLEKLATITNAGRLEAGAEFVLGGNIDLSSIDNWTSIGTETNKFTGKFDGNGYTISNLKINTTNDNVGFFGSTDNLEVINLGLENVDVTGGQSVGGLIGNAHGTSLKMDNTYVTGNINATTKFAGGIIGYTDYNCVVDIQNSFANVNVESAGTCAGGLIGLSRDNVTLEGCYTKGSCISTAQISGGFIGQCGSAGKVTTINNSYSECTISSGTSSAGGLVGAVSSSTTANITSSYSTGNVSAGGNYVGGLVGTVNTSSTANITSSYSTGNVSSGTSNAGGLVGAVAYDSLNHTITDSYFVGSVKGNVSVGGLVGQAINFTVTNSYSDAEVYAEYKHAGGLLGLAARDIAITDSYALGSVKSASYNAGGLVGQLGGSSDVTNATISNCYSKNDIQAQNAQAGGIVGILSDVTLNIIDTQVLGSVSTPDKVGSLVGKAYSTNTLNVSGCSVVSSLSSLETYNLDSGATVTGTIEPLSIASGAVPFSYDYDEYNYNYKFTLERIENNVVFQVGIDGDIASKIWLDFGFKLDFDFDLSSSDSARKSLALIDEQLAKVNAKQTELGAGVNRLESALESIGVQIQNLTSTRSTIRDADIAKESSEYIRQQILQQASATLLATANQTPALALQLL